MTSSSTGGRRWRACSRRSRSATATRTKTFAAKPTGKPGVYRAAVVFPSAGKWTYEVDDGFITGQPHTFPAVQIGAPARAPRRAAATTADDGGPSAGLARDRRHRAAARGRGPARVGPPAPAPSPSAGGVRATILAAGGLACAGAAMTIAAFAGGGSPRIRDRAPAGAPARAAAARRAHGVDRAGLRVLPHVRAGQLERADRPGPRALAARQVARLRDGVDRAAEREGRRRATAIGAMPEDYAQRIAPAGPRPARRVPDGGCAVRLPRVRPRDDPRLRPRASERFYTTVLAVLAKAPDRGGPTPSGATSRSPPAGRSRGTCTSRSSRRRTSSSTRSTAPASRPATSRRSASSARSTTCGCASPTSPRPRASTRRSRPRRARGPHPLARAHAAGRRGQLVRGRQSPPLIRRRASPSSGRRRARSGSRASAPIPPSRCAWRW